MPGEIIQSQLAPNAIPTAASLKQPVRVATNGALPAHAFAANVMTASANGALAAQDGVALAAGDHLLVKDEGGGTHLQNGVYVVTQLGSAGTPWILTRRVDFDGSDEIVSPALIPIDQGTQGELWSLTTDEPITLNTTALTFARSVTVPGGPAGGQLSGTYPNPSVTLGMVANGMVVRTAAATWTPRSLTQPAAGVLISNADGVAGNPTFALANDLLGLEGLGGTGLAVRSAADTWVQRSIVQPAAGITVTNGDGVAGNPTLALANDLAALEALAGTGFAVHSAADSWVERSLVAPAAGLTIANPAGIVGNPTFALANDLAALEALAGTGIAVRTGADAWAQRSIVATSPSIVVADGAGAAGNIGIDTAQDIRTSASPSFAGLTITGDARFQGNVLFSGTAFVSTPETQLISDNHLYMNHGYETAVGQTGGLVVNYLPTATNDTVAAGGFTAGVPAVSNPTVATAAAATFAIGQLIQISGATNPANNGLFEVLSHAANLLTIRGIGLTAAVEDFTQNQFVTSAGAVGTIRRVTVAVLRAGTDGLMEYAAGSATGLAFGDMYYVGGADVAVADGGTGASTAGGARTNLGLVIGTDVQAFDATLLSIAALGTVADRIAYTTGADVWAETPLTAAGRALIDDASAAAQRTTLGLVIGTDVQAFDATLASLAALGTAADRLAYTTGVDTWAEAVLTAAGRALIDDASAAAQRTTLGLVIGTDVQAFDATLLSLAALGTAADRIAYTTGVDTWAEAPLTAFGRSLIDDAAAVNGRTTLGVVIGTDVQAFDAGLLSLAALPTVADRVAYSTALDVWAETPLTAAGRALIDDASAAAQRTTLGLVIGTDVQAFDAGLASLAALPTVADRIAYSTAADVWAETPLTAAGRALIDDASASDQRTTLGLAVGATVDVKVARYQLAADNQVTGPGAETAYTPITLTSANIAEARRIIRFRAAIHCNGRNAADTHRFQLRLGAAGVGGVSIYDSTAQAFVAGDMVYVEGTIVIRVVGAGGSFDAHVRTAQVVGGVPGSGWSYTAGGALDTTVSRDLTPTVLASSANAANDTTLRMAEVEVYDA